MPRFPLVGEEFAGYRITGQLGQGGMGVVFAAEQSGLGRTVALKVLAPQLAEQADYRERFSREATVLANLDSPHIIAIFDHGEHDGCLYIATQYVAGGDLSRALREHGPMPTATAAEITAQVAWAAGDAHAAGVVHRDLKPSNVLLRKTSPDLFAYLCDFGIAQNRSPGVTTTGSVAGTFAYLAPERLNGQPATPAADIYALGCVLWSCLVGGTPFVGTDMQIALGHINGPVPQLAAGSNVARAANRVLQRSLAKDPSQRYPDAGAMRADLQELERVARSTRHATLTAAPGMGVPFPIGGSSASGASAPSGSSSPSRPPGPPPSWTPSGPSHPSSGGSTPPAPGSSPRRRRTGLIVAGVVAAVLAIAGGIGIAVAVGGGDDDPSAGGDSSTSASTQSPTDDPTDSPTDDPSTPTDSPTDSPTTEKPTKRPKPGPTPTYPDVPASRGPLVRLGPASLHALSGWGTIDRYRFDDVDGQGAGARDYGDTDGFRTSVYIYRAKPRVPISTFGADTYLPLLDSLAQQYVKVNKSVNPSLTLLASQRLKPAWLDGLRCARVRAAYRDSAQGNYEFSQETWFVPRGEYIYRVVFENGRSDTLPERRADIDPMVVSFRFGPR